MKKKIPFGLIIAMSVTLLGCTSKISEVTSSENSRNVVEETKSTNEDFNFLDTNYIKYISLSAHDGVSVYTEVIDEYCVSLIDYLKSSTLITKDYELEDWPTKTIAINMIGENEGKYIIECYKEAIVFNGKTYTYDGLGELYDFETKKSNLEEVYDNDVFDFLDTEYMESITIYLEGRDTFYTEDIEKYGALFVDLLKNSRKMTEEDINESDSLGSMVVKMTGKYEGEYEMDIMSEGVTNPGYFRFNDTSYIYSGYKSLTSIIDS